MEIHRIFLQLRYKGTIFSGWQTQPGSPTIEESIEQALFQINGNRIVDITGCGRTDAGVHATNFFAHFDWPSDNDLSLLCHKLNSMLPNDISIIGARKMEPSAHARFDAISRTYHYFIHYEKDPFLEDLSWQFSRKPDIDAMNMAALSLTKHNEFQCFSKVHTDVKNFKCAVTHAQWIPSDKGLVFTITANRFLRGMVRAIVGTMIEVGLGKMSFDEWISVLNSGDRSEAGMAVPAKGLFLADVKYPYPVSQYG